MCRLDNRTCELQMAQLGAQPTVDRKQVRDNHCTSTKQGVYFVYLVILPSFLSNQNAGIAHILVKISIKNLPRFIIVRTGIL